MNKVNKPEVLILGPGGMKVFLELGALLELESRNFLDKVHTFIGCSIGSLVALLLTCGFKTIEIINDLLNENIAENFMFSLERITEKNGIINPNIIRQKLSKKLLTKFNIVPNLEQLYFFTGINFISISLNITKDSVEALSKDTEPYLSCVDAVLMSMNIPGIFCPIIYKNCFYIDGALGNPYPVDIKDDGQTRILGISIEEKVTNLHENFYYIYKVIQSSMIQLKKKIIENCSTFCEHIVIPSDWIDTLGVTISNKEKIEMIIKGFFEAKKKFTKN
ncbi:MAG: patatin-like phospholipase family protein [Candidatus Aenigmatarchaeota archaeon]|jgi:predicted acylesterase/phospholipase RssA